MVVECWVLMDGIKGGFAISFVGYDVEWWSLESYSVHMDLKD
jgi:hypothetical protein